MSSVVADVASVAAGAGLVAAAYFLHADAWEGFFGTMAEMKAHMLADVGPGMAYPDEAAALQEFGVSPLLR